MYICAGVYLFKSGMCMLGPGVYVRVYVYICAWVGYMRMHTHAWVVTHTTHVRDLSNCFAKGVSALSPPHPLMQRFTTPPSALTTTPPTAPTSCKGLPRALVRLLAVLRI